MAAVLPPDASVTFIVALIVPLIIGFLVGIILKSAIKIGVALVLIVLVLMFAGMISPSQVLEPLLSLIRTGSGLSTKVAQVAGYLPYSSVTFLAGLAAGFFKG